MSDPAGVPPDGNLLERVCGGLAKLALVLMMLAMGAELVLRNAFGYSWQATDEVAGYLLVAVTFLSLATSQAHGGYHELLLVKNRLSPRARGWLEVAMQALCLVCAAVLTWYFVRLVIGSWNAEERSMASLRVPLWIPRLTMPLGTAALCVTLVLTIRRTLRGIRASVAAERGP
jgi:TRAP-type C4-dicarboxylate transport system permease small subunit